MATNPHSFDDAQDFPVKAGDVLVGKYRVERVLGRGGMGVVVAAFHEQLGRMVALKFVLAGSEPAAIERFVREARAAVRLKSEHVAKVLDVGTMDENGTPYIVMEYLEGADLAAILEERGPLAPEHAVDYVLQACEAVAEAHALGIIHRDLKPHNLFLTRRVDGAPLVKVLDFGISKTLSPDSGPHLTRTNVPVGSPLYMSPEQMRSPRLVDGRSDVWALGVVLYELLTGEPPFKGSSIPEICIKAVTDDPPAIGRADVSRDLENIILRCLAKDPNGRYTTVADLAAALAPFAPSGSAAAASCRKIGLDRGTSETLHFHPRARAGGASPNPQGGSDRPGYFSPPPFPAGIGVTTPVHALLNAKSATRIGSSGLTPATWNRTGSNSPSSWRAAGALFGCLALLVAALGAYRWHVSHRELASHDALRPSDGGPVTIASGVNDPNASDKHKIDPTTIATAREDDVSSTTLTSAPITLPTSTAQAVESAAPLGSAPVATAGRPWTQPYVAPKSVPTAAAPLGHAPAVRPAEPAGTQSVGRRERTDDPPSRPGNKPTSTATAVPTNKPPVDDDIPSVR